MLCIAAGAASAATLDPIRVTADHAQCWDAGQEQVWLLRGHVVVAQGASRAHAREAVLWVEQGRYGQPTGRITAYMEGAVSMDDGAWEAEDQAKDASRLGDASWLGAFEGPGPPTIDIAQGIDERPARMPPIVARADQRREQAARGAVRLVQLNQPVGVAPIADEEVPSGSRRLRAYGRGDSLPSARILPGQREQEWVAVIDGGILLVIDGLEEDIQGVGAVDTVTVEADRMVIWTQGNEQLDLGGSNLQNRDTPLEIYMEGNLVFRQGDRVIYAERMYYNVREQRGVVLNAEVLSPVPNYQGLLRLKAAVVQQSAKGQFTAQDAFITSSRLGVPSYRLESKSIFFSDEDVPVVNQFTGLPEFDPQTGEAVLDHKRQAESYNNFLKIGELPVLFWPALVTDLEDPTYYIRRFTFKQDSIFGTQVLTEFDLYQLLGMRKIDGTDWDLSLDYLSLRGLAAGTRFRYQRTDEIFGAPSPYSGFIDVWGLYDSGRDVLGADRFLLTPEERFRYRILGQHRQLFEDGFQFTAELGITSDRNFLEQYYENEWDEFKDQTTGVELKQLVDNWSWSVSGDLRLNDHYAQTEGVRADHFWLGQPLLNDLLTWHEHSSIGYAHLEPGSFPENPVEQAKFRTLPWERDADGLKFTTRQEVDLPLAAGPFKIVPYALGEIGYWGEALDGDDLQRAYGQLGVRASLPIWSANPAIESEIFNVHGVAHKVMFDAEFLFADSTADVTELPLYEQLDDDNIEQFRRRFAFNTFNAPTVPFQFDERSYAVRSGLGSWVTSPSAEVVDDITMFRLGARQRWQTKRGPPDNLRIIDWITLDTRFSLFPNPDRDNFGEVLGLAEYDFRWHVGDRVTLLSSGQFDFFDQGQENINLGMVLNTFGRASLYVNFAHLGGPIDSDLVSTTVSYRLSPKWLASASVAVDISGGGNIGEYVTLTRIGESFLISLRFYNDVSKDNVGMSFIVEPRFLPKLLGNVAGEPILPAGARGLE